MGKKHCLRIPPNPNARTLSGGSFASSLPGSPSALSETKSVIKRISVAKFRAIMKRAPKEYNVDSIIKDLQDPTGQFIELNIIPTYHKRLQTMNSGSFDKFKHLDRLRVLHRALSHSEEIESTYNYDLPHSKALNISIDVADDDEVTATNHRHFQGYSDRLDDLDHDDISFGNDNGNSTR